MDGRRARERQEGEARSPLPLYLLSSTWAPACLGRHPLRLRCHFEQEDVEPSAADPGSWAWNEGKQQKKGHAAWIDGTPSARIPGAPGSLPTARTCEERRRTHPRSQEARRQNPSRRRKSPSPPRCRPDRSQHPSHDCRIPLLQPSSTTDARHRR